MQIPQPARRLLSLHPVSLPRDPGEAVRLKSVAKLVGSDGPLVARMITPEQFAILLPLACVWAEEQERIILRDGVALATAQIGDAKRVGITHPERVKVRVVDEIPSTAHPALRRAAEMTGLISPLTAGLTLRYGIFIRSDLWGERRLVVHELAHVAQYERFGGFRPFLEQYLHECITIGYPAAPLEQEAKRIENELCD